MTVFASLWSVMGYIVPFVFVLSMVVFFHELGHFLVGRWCGVKVDAFSIGFGPELFAFVDRQNTRWRIALLPLGGYVKFHGDANAASAASKDPTLAMPEAERRVSFYTQPVWRRAAIVVAGPVANFILALVIFTGVFLFSGRDILTPRIESIRPGEAADGAGFAPGDLIVAIDGEAIGSWSAMQRVVQAAPGRELAFLVERGGKDVMVKVTPRLQVLDSRFGQTKVGIVGLVALSKPENWTQQTFGPIGAVREAMNETWFVTERTLDFIGGLFVGKQSLKDVNGPVGTGYIAGEVAKFGFVALMNLAAVLSISVGLINLFPVPMLDGGHLMFYLFEALKGRPISERAQEFGFRIGLALVLCLMLFATFNDVVHLSRG